MDSLITPLVSNINLFAKIKRSSKYYYQGLNNNKPELFQIKEIRDGSHPFKLNCNSYRSEDLAFYVKGVGEMLIKL